MLILFDTILFSETVKDEGVGGGYGPVGGMGIVVLDLCQRGGTLGFGQVGNYLGAVLEGRTLGHEKGSPTSAS